MRFFDLILKKYGFLFLLGLTFLIVHYSPQLLDRVQPDSSSYLNPSPFRQILYNLLYVSLQKINIDIIFFQEFLMSLSIVCLFYFLKKKKISKVLLVLFYLLLTLNFYYTSFSKTILTESIFFSLINFAFILLFNLQNKYILLTFGLICGMIVSLKPVGIVFTFIFFVFSFFFTRSYKKLIQILILAILPLILENIVFYNKFDERKNIVSFSVVGKLFLLSGKDSFDVRQYPEKYHKLLNLTKKKFEPIHSYLEKIDNVLLRFELLSDYEAVAQYRILKYDVDNLNLDHKEILKDKNYLFYQIIKNNFWDYLKLSLSHYIGNWSIGNKNNFLEKEKINIPNISELINSSGPMNLPNKKLIMLAQIFFIALFIALVIHSMLVIKIAILRSENLKREDLVLILLIQIYLLAVSFSNISTPRYLMAIYPFLLIICINFFSLIKAMINKNN